MDDIPKHLTAAAQTLTDHDVALCSKSKCEVHDPKRAYYCSDDLKEIADILRRKYKMA